MPGAMSDYLSNWSFFVDTGGTFTDCLALDPRGTVHRAKVLSRGSLSARIASIESDNCLRLDGSPDWPDGFPVGFRMVGEDGKYRVSGWNKQSSLLQLDGQLPKSLQFGDAIELLSGEEAPVLGQRLILARTGLSPKEISVTLRLATTRCTNALLEGKGTGIAGNIRTCPPHIEVDKFL